MKQGKILIYLIFITIIVLSVLIFSPFKKQEAAEFIKGYISDSIIDNRKVYTETLIDYYDGEPNWQPNKKSGTALQPQIIGESGILVDINSEDILFEKNSNQKRKIASLVKIMTAVVALEHKRLDENIFISPVAASIGENIMGVSEGEVYTLEELLYGLILHSGNDAAYAIAEGVAGDQETFTDWMNMKAQEIGLKDTYFVDPSGLDDSTYSTPIDLVKLTRYALKNPKFREIVKTVEHEIYGDEDNKYIYLYNQTNLLTTYPGVLGVKTGYTTEAGLCLVTYANNNGKEVVGVVLNSVDRKGDMILMLDHGFSSLGVYIEHSLL